MPDTPLVSIILPVWNADSFLDESIQSILNQSYTNWELIICDDASEDKSLSIIRKYAKRDRRIIESHNKTNQKLLKTRNRLFELCKGEYITFQDADDISDKNRIQKQLEIFLKDSSLGICGCFGRAIFEDGSSGVSLTKPENDEDIKTFSRRFNAFIGSTVMIPSKVYKEIGGFRSFFDGMSYQDYDWSCLIAEKYRAYNIPEELYYYRQYGKSNSKIIDLDRLLAIEYVRFLIKQRLENSGTDALSDPSLKLVFDDFIQKLKVPYLQDRSKLFRDYAGIFMYGKLYSEALSAAFKAIKKEPKKLNNYKTYLYCLRISLFN